MGEVREDIARARGRELPRQIRDHDAGIRGDTEREVARRGVERDDNGAGRTWIELLPRDEHTAIHCAGMHESIRMSHEDGRRSRGADRSDDLAQVGLIQLEPIGRWRGEAPARWPVSELRLRIAPTKPARDAIWHQLFELAPEAIDDSWMQSTTPRRHRAASGAVGSRRLWRLLDEVLRGGRVEHDHVGTKAPHAVAHVLLDGRQGHPWQCGVQYFES